MTKNHGRTKKSAFQISLLIDRMKSIVAFKI